MQSAVALLALLAASVCLALDPHQGLRHYGYQSWQTESGLPQNTVHAVLQTRDGYLWLGTEAGLVRFDATQFRVWTAGNTPALGSSLISSLIEDRSGALWIGTSSGVTRYAGGSFQSFARQSAAPTSAVWSMHQDRQGNLWFLAAGGLTVYDGQHFTAISTLPPLDENSKMVETADGSLWIATIGGLYRAASGSQTFQAIGATTSIQALALDINGHLWIGTPLGIASCTATGCNDSKNIGNVRALTIDVQGHLWAGTGNGLFSYDGKKLIHWSAHNGLPSDSINLLQCDREGAVWIGTANGIARLVNGTLESFSPREGFSSSLVLAFYEDREGSFWIGTESGGLDILRDRTFTSYAAEDGLSDDHVRSVYQDQAGGIWLGTNGGGLNRRTPQGFAAITIADGLSSNVILAIAGESNGDLWLGTPDGLDRMHGKTVKRFTSADGLADDFVRSLYFDKQGALWIGTRRGLSQLKDGKFKTYTALDGLGGDLIGAMLQSRDGALWISTLGGLTRYEHGAFHNFTVKDGLTNPVVTALFEDADGTLWVGTNGGGLDRYRNGKFQPIAAKAAALPHNIYSILEDAEGYLWLGSSAGIARVSRDALNGDTAHVEVANYGAADGMKSSEASSGGHPVAWRMQDGSLWFATLKGAATVDPEHLAINRVPPLVSIQQVNVDDHPEKVTDTVTIAPGQHRLAVEYAALSFVAPQKVRFQYRLKGFDRNWIEAGAQRIAYYTNLAPGKYTFEVQARNNDGVQSENPAALGLQLQPYFYQTVWFYLLLALTLSLLGYAAYLWKLRRRLRLAEARFEGVLKERNRIAREIHDTLAQGFVAVSVQLQIVGRLMERSGEAVQQHNDQAGQHLKQAQALVRHGLEDARRAIWELRSQSTEDLPGKLIQMADRVIGARQIESHVHVHGVYRPLDEKTEAELLRIAQEAVTNAVRHADPAHIEIRLHFVEKKMELRIEDDGRGFSSEAPSAHDGHFGLTGMQERAQQIGGKLTVQSKLEKGTSVSLVLATEEQT